MVRILKVQRNPKVNTVSGFEVKFPQELIGVVSVKEYLHAIEIINSNAIREFYTYYLYSLYCGLLPIIIFWIANIFRWYSFKNQVKRDLKPVIEAINRSMLQRGVSFKIKYGGELNLEISYPDDSTRPIPNTTVTIDGKTAILLDPFFEPQPLIQNPRVRFQPGEPTDPNFRNVILTTCTPITSGTRPFIKLYKDELYNYLSLQEFNAIVDEYNSSIKTVPFNKNIAIFFLVSAFSVLILIGMILILPAMIMYQQMINTYNSKIDSLFKELDAKYNALYNQRGISFASSRETFNNGIVYLHFNFPRDVVYGPVLTTLLPGNQLMLAQTVPGGIAPNYHSIQQQPQVTLYTC